MSLELYCPVCQIKLESNFRFSLVNWMSYSHPEHTGCNIEMFFVQSDGLNWQLSIVFLPLEESLDFRNFELLMISQPNSYFDQFFASNNEEPKMWIFKSQRPHSVKVDPIQPQKAIVQAWQEYHHAYSSLMFRLKKVDKFL